MRENDRIFHTCAQLEKIISSCFKISLIFSRSKTFKMIGWKTIITTISVLTYVVLLYRFYDLHVDDKDNPNCNWERPCIRLCTEDRSEKKILLAKLNDKILKDTRIENYTISHGEPMCIDSSMDYFHSNMRFRPVSRFFSYWFWFF